MKELPSSLFQRRWKDRTKAGSSLVSSSWLNCPDSYTLPLPLFSLYRRKISLCSFFPSLARDPASQNDTLSRMKIATTATIHIMLHRARFSSFGGEGKTIGFQRNVFVNSLLKKPIQAGCTPVEWNNSQRAANVPGTGCRRDWGRLPLLGFHPTTSLR